MKMLYYLGLHWTVFEDNIVICSESRGQVEVSLKRWRHALERRGMKIIGGETESMSVNEMEMGEDAEVSVSRGSEDRQRWNTWVNYPK